MHRSIEVRAAAAPLPRRAIPSALVVLSSLALLAITVDRAVAAPVIDLSWNACSPIVVGTFPQPGQTVTSIYGSVTGMTDAHRGYGVDFWFASEVECHMPATTPDAWRFDPGGCQPEGAARVALSSNDPACPSLGGSAVPFIAYSAIEDSPSKDQTPAGALRVRVVQAYVEPQIPDPGIRYFLFKLEFDHAASVVGEGTPGVTCGGYERPICAALWPQNGTLGCSFGSVHAANAYFIEAGGAMTGFQAGQGFLSFGLEAGTAFSCFEYVSGHVATWGAIKAQYR